jgi:pimeloyl-ACP methyl ester carboxylesterase
MRGALLLGVATLLCTPAAIAQPAAPPQAQEQAGNRLTLAQLRARYGDRASRYATIDGLEIHYKDEGQGPVLLMVHGSRSSLRQWDGVVAQLKGRYRIIRYDIPGAGLSGGVDDAAAQRVAPTDIAEGLLARLGVRRVTVVGVSSGGTLGMFLAAKRPDLVERLILANTPADPVKYDHLRYSPALTAAMQRVKDTGVEDMAFWNAYLDFFSGDGRRIDAAKRTAYYDLNRRVPEKNALALVAKIGDGVEARKRMAAVRAPVLLLWGAADPLLVPASAKALAGYLSAAQVSTVMMPDVGHYPPTEVPVRFARLVAAYIEAATPGK